MKRRTPTVAKRPASLTAPVRGSNHQPCLHGRADQPRQIDGRPLPVFGKRHDLDDRKALRQATVQHSFQWSRVIGSWCQPVHAVVVSPVFRASSTPSAVARRTKAEATDEDPCKMEAVGETALQGDGVDILIAMQQATCGAG